MRRGGNALRVEVKGLLGTALGYLLLSGSILYVPIKPEL